jgi:EAL domain-containing protein (putative c-di-GMP-specific phosphodiesterase class I)
MIRGSMLAKRSHCSARGLAFSANPRACRIHILHLRRHDDSTANRTDVGEHLGGALSRAARGERFALIFLEFDAFKAVNKSFGNPIGDDQLRQTLIANEFELKFRPIINLAQNQVVSSEALIRWRKPDVGLVLPAEFIPFAEETGLIAALGDWVLKQACSTAGSWPDNIMVAVNVAASQLKAPGLVGTIVDGLENSGLSASRLGLEISELTLLNDDKSSLNTLREVRAIGVRIALENFGAGYSSPGYLKSFPIDIIKIDPSLINPIAAENNSKEIFRAIVTLARSLAETTKVKGIELEERLNLARDVGCDEAQRNLICPPPAVEGADCAWQPDQNASRRSLLAVGTGARIGSMGQVARASLDIGAGSVGDRIDWRASRDLYEAE